MYRSVQTELTYLNGLPRHLFPISDTEIISVSKSREWDSCEILSHWLILDVRTWARKHFSLYCFPFLNVLICLTEVSNYFCSCVSWYLLTNFTKIVSLLSQAFCGGSRQHTIVSSCYRTCGWIDPKLNQNSKSQSSPHPFSAQVNTVFRQWTEWLISAFSGRTSGSWNDLVLLNFNSVLITQARGRNPYIDLKIAVIFLCICELSNLTCPRAQRCIQCR